MTNAASQPTPAAPPSDAELPAPEPASDAAPADTGRQRAVAGGMWIATSRLLPLVGTAVLSISIARILGPDALGLQNYVAFVDVLLATAVQWVLITVSIQQLSRAHGVGDAEAVSRLERAVFLLNVLGGAGSAVVLLSIAATSPTPLPWVFAAINAVVNGIAWGYGVRIIAADGWTPVARTRLVTQLTAVALGLGAVVVGLGIAGVFAAIALASALFAVILRRRHGPLRWGPVRPIPGGLVVVWAQMFALEVLVQWVMQKSEVLFLQHWASHTQIAMFSVAFMVVATAAALPVALVVSGLPSVANSLGAGTIDATLTRLGHPVRIALMASVPLGAFVAAVGPSAVSALYGAEFQTAAELVPMQAVALLTATAGMVCVTFWIGAGQFGPLMVAAGAGVIVNIGLAVALIPQHQAWGAVFASVAGQTVMAALVLGWTHHRGAGLSLPVLRWAASLAGAVVWVWLMAELRGAIGWDSAAGRWLGLLVVGAATTVGLALAGMALGYIDRRDRQWLLESLPPRLRPLGRLLAGPTPSTGAFSDE